MSMIPGVWRLLTPDGRLLFVTRFTRLFAYGFLSILLVLYLTEVGLSDAQIGLLLTLTLIGDGAVSLWLTTLADRLGRRRTLLIGAVLMVLAGGVFAVTRNFALLLLAATIGVISPSGNEVGPFLSVEQASLSHVLPDRERTRVFAWYNLIGSLATALGALIAGGLAQLLQRAGVEALTSHRAVVIAYASMGVALGLLFLRLSPQIEAQPSDDRSAAISGARAFMGLHRSRRVVAKLSSLFMLDAFAGGLAMQSIIAYWFHLRYGVEPAMLGGIFFGANILAGISALTASRLAARFGLINTMVFTHIPSNILLILVPLMPNLPLAVTVLLLRFSISQMDVPTRQSYTMAVVSPDERSAAAGVTGVARTTGAALSPIFLGALMRSASALGAVFFIAGGLKIVYDLLLFRSFRAVRPGEETRQQPPSPSPAKRGCQG